MKPPQIHKPHIFYKCIYRYRCQHKVQDKKTKKPLCTSKNPCYYKIPITLHKLEGSETNMNKLKEKAKTVSEWYDELMPIQSVDSEGVFRMSSGVLLVRLEDAQKEIDELKQKLHKILVEEYPSNWSPCAVAETKLYKIRELLK